MRSEKKKKKELGNPKFYSIIFFFTNLFITFPNNYYEKLIFFMSISRLIFSDFYTFGKCLKFSLNLTFDRTVPFRLS